MQNTSVFQIFDICPDSHWTEVEGTFCKPAAALLQLAAYRTIISSSVYLDAFLLEPESPSENVYFVCFQVIILRGDPGENCLIIAHNNSILLIS